MDRANNGIYSVYKQGCTFPLLLFPFCSVLFSSVRIRSGGEAAIPIHCLPMKRAPIPDQTNKKFTNNVYFCKSFHSVGCLTSQADRVVLSLFPFGSVSVLFSSVRIRSGGEAAIPLHHFLMKRAQLQDQTNNK